MLRRDECDGSAWMWPGDNYDRYDEPRDPAGLPAQRDANRNEEKPRPAPSDLFNITTKRLTMKGLIVRDWLDRQSEFEKE